MQDIKYFKQADLVLKVNHAYDTNKLDLCAWEPFIDRLCGDRTCLKTLMNYTDRKQDILLLLL